MIKKLFNDKKKITLIIVLIVVLIMVGILVGFFRKDDYIGVSVNSDGEKIKREYENLNGELSKDEKEYPKVTISADNILKYTTVDGVLDILEDGNAVVYFGSATCIYCRNAIQVLYDTVKDTKLEELYYLDVDTITEEANYDKLLVELGDRFIIDYKINMPVVIFVVNGDIVSSNVGTLFSQEDPYQEMDESQIEGLSEIYRYGIRDVLDGISVYGKNSN